MYNKFVDVYSKYLKSDTTDDFWLVDSIKTKHFLFNVGSSSFMNFRLIKKWTLIGEFITHPNILSFIKRNKNP